MRFRWPTSLVAIGLIVGPFMGSAAPAAAATTFVVNRTGDAADMNLADTACDTSANAGLQCTLRAAIQESNDTPDRDNIDFNITSSGKVIRPNSPLPPITDEVLINGYSQTGAAENTLAVGTNAVLKIVLDGTNAGASASGLELRTTGTFVSGLVIQNWAVAGINIPGDGSFGAPNVIHGCYIGTNAAGTLARGNGIGIWAQATQQNIGGDVSWRNVISGNDTGILTEAGVSNVVVLGNYIGTNAAGTSALGNIEGLDLHGTHAQVGGEFEDERNVISGNSSIGIVISGSGNTDGTNVVEGNYIGTKADGLTALPNGHGIFIAGSDNNFIGGDSFAPNLIANNNGEGIWLLQDAAGTTIHGNTIKANGANGIVVQSGPNSIISNTIRNNGTDGVHVDNSATRVTISSNLMQANGGLGIDLEGGSENAFGVTGNDADDPDSGANRRQNFPVLVSAVRNSSTKVTEVVVRLDSTPSTQFRIELYRSIPDASGHGEGGARVAVTVTSTDGKGDKTFSFLLSNIAAGTRLTATATATGTGDTSEFSANRTIVSN